MLFFFSALTRGRFPALWRIQRSSVYLTLNIDICTWKPKDPCLIGKGLLLEGWTKQTGSRYFQLVVTWVSGCCHRMSKWNKATGIIFQFLSSPTLLNVWYIIWYAYIWGIWEGTRIGKYAPQMGFSVFRRAQFGHSFQALDSLTEWGGRKKLPHLGGGNSNIFIFHPKDLGKWSNLTCAYFSGWVGVKPSPKSHRWGVFKTKKIGRLWPFESARCTFFSIES